MAPPCLNLQEKISFLPWVSSFGLLLFFLPKSRLFPSLFRVYLAGNGRPLIFSSKRISSLLCFGIFWESLGRPLDLWSYGGLLLIWCMKEGGCHLWSGDQRLLDVHMAPLGLGVWLGVWFPLAWSWKKM